MQPTTFIPLSRAALLAVLATIQNGPTYAHQDIVSFAGMCSRDEVAEHTDAAGDNVQAAHERAEPVLSCLVAGLEALDGHPGDVASGLLRDACLAGEPPGSVVRASRSAIARRVKSRGEMPSRSAARLIRSPRPARCGGGT